MTATPDQNSTDSQTIDNAVASGGTLVVKKGRGQRHGAAGHAMKSWALGGAGTVRGFQAHQALAALARWAPLAEGEDVAFVVLVPGPCPTRDLKQVVHDKCREAPHRGAADVKEGDTIFNLRFT